MRKVKGNAQSNQSGRRSRAVADAPRLGRNPLERVVDFKLESLGE
jgi:hypothetical protein